jgi:hypothetical protein
MKVGDLVIISSLGEIKVYKASPRTPEAEVGLKPNEVKLDFETAIDIVEAHKKLQDLITDTRGEFKAGFLNRATSGEKHNLEQEIYKEAIKALAEDIDMIIEKADKKVFLSVPKTISNDLLSHLKNKDKIFRIVEKDLIKEKDTNRLIEEFKPQF